MGRKKTVTPAGENQPEVKEVSQEEMAEMLAEAFENNPTVNELFQTTDGQCFYTEGYAKFHARSLAETAREVTKNERKTENEA